MDDSSRVHLNISGMDCNNCAMGITNMLKKKGLEDAEVNFATGEAFFTPKNNVPLTTVIESINEMGYKVVEDASKEPTPFLSPGRKVILSAIFTVPLLLNMIPGLTFLQHPLVQLALCIPVMVIGILQFGRSAIVSLKNFFPNMDVLIFTGFMAAFIYSVIGTFFTPQQHAHHYLFYETAASIITLVLLGNYIEHKAVKKTASSVDALVKLKPLTARIIITMAGKEKYLLTETKNLKVTDLVLVTTGERIPADGKVMDGFGFADQSMFTGESEPFLLERDKKVIGGSVLTEGNIKVEVEKTGEDAYLSKLIELVKKASFNKPRIQQLGDKVSAIFVPVVIGISLLTYFAARFIFHVDNFHSIMNAIAVLVISCPCAMGLATPTAVMVGIGRSARQGILIKGGDTLQLFAESKQFLFDKTGTLTTGNFSIDKIEIHNANYSEEQVKKIIYAIESHSTHPIARSISNLLKDYEGDAFDSYEEIKGIGMIAKKGNDVFQLGSERLLPQENIRRGARLFLLKNKELIASVYTDDVVKPGGEELVSYLRNKGIDAAIISGDVESKCKTVAEKTGIKKFFSSLLPHQKLELIEKAKQKNYVTMIGDGINDAPSLTAAHVGISFANASDIAIQNANVIILNNSIEKISEAHLLARHTLQTIKQNLFWAFCYNVVAIPLAATGFLNPMWGAAFMAFSDIMVIGNSIRLNYKKLR
jgi:P-type Cu+ transporter